jgi:hypothetical protein
MIGYSEQMKQLEDEFLNYTGDAPQDVIDHEEFFRRMKSHMPWLPDGALRQLLHQC